MTYIQLQNKFPTQQSIITHFISIRYPNGITCPHCNANSKISLRNDRPKLTNCNSCKNTFSIFKDTIFEKSSVDLRKWFYAINLCLNAKKGISACQLQREIGVTYKTAWRMLKQIRTAMGNENLKNTFELIVEVDETYIGGRPRKSNYNTATKRRYYKKGRGTSKTPVISIRERGTGKVYAKVAATDYNGRRLSGKQLLNVIETVAKENSVVMTDDFTGYNILNHKKTNPNHYTHITVNHSVGQYSAGNGIHTNGIEGFWAIVKRSVYGTYHHISVKYMQDYINECCFKQNHRGDEAFDKLLALGINT